VEENVRTNNGRGTQGYRAPELLREMSNSGLPVGCAIDIWGLGCILFELLFREKAFPGDYETQQHAHAMLRRQPSPLDPVTRAQKYVTVDDDHTFGITELVKTTLDVEPKGRPDAKDLLARFTGFRQSEVSPPPGDQSSASTRASISPCELSLTRR
jgi:serine/threonine protein kinase